MKWAIRFLVTQILQITYYLGNEKSTPDLDQTETPCGEKGSMNTTIIQALHAQFGIGSSLVFAGNQATDNTNPISRSDKVS